MDGHHHPDATDSRHTAARALGIPLINPTAGWKRLNEAIREAELKAFECQRSIDEAAAYRQQRADENDAYWRLTWRAQELGRDPEYERWERRTIRERQRLLQGYLAQYSCR